ncbi:MAG: hypothetical protein ACQEWI_10480 [Bacillota bacterium]
MALFVNVVAILQKKVVVDFRCRMLAFRRAVGEPPRRCAPAEVRACRDPGRGVVPLTIQHTLVDRAPTRSYVTKQQSLRKESLV